MRKFVKYVPIILIIILSVLAAMFGLQQYFSVNHLKEHREIIEHFIVQHEVYALLIFGLIYITITGASIPGATFLTMVGGFLFGQIIGTLVVVICATLGASIIFLSTSLATSEFLKQKSRPWLTKMQQGFKNNSISYLLTLRLIPLFPFVAVNLVCAFLKVPFRTFFFTTLIGIIPGSFVYVSLGVAMREVINQPEFTPIVILNPKILIALCGLGIITLLPVVYKRLHRSD